MRTLLAWRHPHADGSVTFYQQRGDIRLSMSISATIRSSCLREFLVCEAGRKVAFVGATVCGQDTITNLINRFYDVPTARSLTTVSTSTDS
jgi:ATP-binding cassette subfamily B protein